MHNPAAGLFDSRDVATLSVVSTFLRYPYEYLLRAENLARLTPLTSVDIGLQKMVEAAACAQAYVASLPPLQGAREIWHDYKKNSSFKNFRTALKVVSERTDITSRGVLEQKLNLNILESIVTSTANESGNPNYSQLEARAACIWLAHHISLIILGIARVRVDDMGRRFTIEILSVEKSKQLRRVWFGTAFEEQSLSGQSAKIEALAFAKAHPNQEVADITELITDALSVFPAQMRLPGGKGPIHELIDKVLFPVLKLLVSVFAESQRSSAPRPIQREHVEQLGVATLFEKVLASQSKLKIVDRLFDIKANGLILGTRKIAPGLLKLIEDLANDEFGENWHGNVSEVQTEYFVERLSQNLHVEIVKIDGVVCELRQCHTANNSTPIDVDVFVRDRIHSCIYAVQLKHFENGENGTFLDWIARFGNAKKRMGKAVYQLQNLSNLLREDIKVRSRLAEMGISEEEFSSIVPVVVHNIGTMDLWELQNSVRLFDLHTFCNVIAGRAFTYIKTESGKIYSGALNGVPEVGPCINDPESIISEYLRDPKFFELKSFDLAERTIRTLEFGGVIFEAHGLGI